jgi:hypothetical protein
MKYYKYLDLNYLPAAEKLKVYVLDRKDEIKHFWTALDSTKILQLFPEVQKMFDPMEITVSSISIIKVDKYTPQGGIHRDVSKCHVRINIPILNCVGSVTNFYRSTTEPEMSFLKNGVSYYSFPYSDCVLVDSFCLDKPAAIRITEPHQVVISQHHVEHHAPRISCTVEFKENIDHLLND